MTLCQGPPMRGYLGLRLIAWRPLRQLAGAVLRSTTRMRCYMCCSNSELPRRGQHIALPTGNHCMMRQVPSTCPPGSVSRAEVGFHHAGRTCRGGKSTYCGSHYKLAQVWSKVRTCSESRLVSPDEPVYPSQAIAWPKIELFDTLDMHGTSAAYGVCEHQSWTSEEQIRSG